MGIRSIKRTLPLIVLVLVMSACKAGALSRQPTPTLVAMATATRKPRPTQVVPSVTPTVDPKVTVDGATFFFDPSLGYVTGGAVVADTADIGSEDWMLPARFEFTVTKYPLTKSEMTPRIVLYPVAALAGFNDAGADTVKALADLISKKTDPAQITGPIPQLTNPQDPEMFHAQVKYLDFKNGSGVRFITQYASDVRPINNQDLVYHFEGITSDGSYVVAVMLPLSQKDLPASEDSLTNAQSDALANDFLKAITDAAKDLDIASDSTFKPKLSLLDSLVESFDVTATAPPDATVAPEDMTPTSLPQPTPTPEIKLTPAQ